MRRNWRTLRRALGGPVSALVLFAGAAGPLLDAADLRVETLLVSGEAPAPGNSGHDHRLCIQIGASQAIASHEAVRPAAWPAGTEDPSGTVPSGRSSREREVSPARAPPSR